MEQTGLNTGTPADTDVIESVEQTAEPEVSTEESAQAGEGVVTETQETEPAPQPRKQTGQERIDEITKKFRTEERLRLAKEQEIEYWRNQALQVQAQKPAEQLNPVSDRPRLENFQTTEDYEDAFYDWKRSKEIVAQRQIAQVEANAKLEKDFIEKAQKLKQEYPDIEEVIQAPVFTPVMRQAIFDSDNGAVLAYHLALPDNRVFANSLSAKPPHLQLVELGKFEANMLLGKATNKNTKAPAPIKPVGAPAGGETSVDESKLQDNDWFAYKEKQRREAIVKRQQKLGG